MSEEEIDGPAALETEPVQEETDGSPGEHRLGRVLLCAAPLLLAVWRCVDGFRLLSHDGWSYYHRPPNLAFWLLILGLSLLALRPQIPFGMVKAGFFVWAVLFLWVMPPEAGSRTAHPDIFLAYEVDRVSGSLWDARQKRALPTHPLDLRKMLSESVQLNYRRGDKEWLDLRVDISVNASGPVLEPSDRPGVIQVAVEQGGDSLIWITATGLAGRRIGPPALILDPASGKPAVIVVRNPRPVSLPEQQQAAPPDRTPDEDGGPD